MKWLEIANKVGQLVYWTLGSIVFVRVLIAAKRMGL